MAEKARQHVAEENAEGRGAVEAGRLDEVLGTQREEPAAHDARKPCPADHRQEVLEVRYELLERRRCQVPRHVTAGEQRKLLLIDLRIS